MPTQTQEEPIAACPFCGLPAVALKDGHPHVVKCLSCLAVGPSENSEEDAVLFWNRRAKSEELEQLKKVNADLAWIAASVAKDGAAKFNPTT